MPASAYAPRPDGDTTKCRYPGCEAVKGRARAICEPHAYQRYAIDRELAIKAADRDSLGRKYCFGCKAWKAESAFYKSGPSRADGLKARCKVCTNAARKAHMYGVSEDWLLTKLIEQRGQCPICLNNLGEIWYVDHDHECCPGEGSCGKCVRGLLCRGCNVGLGIFADDRERLQRAIAYLG